MKNTREQVSSDDEEIAELMETEGESSEFEDDSEDPAPIGRKVPPQVVKVVPRMAVPQQPRQAVQVPQVPKRAPEVPAVDSTGSILASKRYIAAFQPQRIAVTFADSGEPAAEPRDMPLWAAEMWADIKNELTSIREAIGKI